MRLALGVMATVAGMVPQKAEAKRDVCHTRKCETRVASKQCSERRFNRCLDYAHYVYGTPRYWLYGVSRCESGWNRWARNPSGSTSYFQFLYSTWRTTPFGRHSIYSPRYQALAAAWMWKRGRSGEWVCRA